MFLSTSGRLDILIIINRHRAAEADEDNDGIWSLSSSRRPYLRA